MPHQMKGIGDGRQDVRLAITEIWKSVHEQSDEVHKAILNPTYVKTSSMFANLITFKFMLKVLGKRSWISIYSNFVGSIRLTMLLIFVDCRLVKS
jgi:hypothetical protein